MDRTMNNKSAGAANPAARIAPAVEQGQPDLYEEEIVEPEAERGSRIRNFIFNPYLTLVSRFFLGAILLISGITKMGVTEAFVININAYEMHLPSAVVQLMAVTLPPLELALGLLLFVGLWIQLSAAVSGVLMVVFIVAMTQAAFRGLSPDCGCFAGPQSNPVGTALMNALGPVGTFLSTETVGWESILRDVVFLLMAVHLVFVPSIFSIDNWRYRRHEAELAREESEEGDEPEVAEWDEEGAEQGAV